MRAALAFAFAAAACSADAAVPAPPRPALVTLGPDATGTGVAASERWPDGCRVAVVDLARPASAPLVLSDGLAAAGGPAVRWDGGLVAFVARERAGEAFAVWTCNPDGSGRSKVAGGAADCGSVAFLGDGRIVWSQAVSESEWAFFVGDTAGGAAQRITFSGGTDTAPSVLPDGRVVFASRAKDAAEFALFSVHVDGTGVAAYRGSHRTHALPPRDEPVPLAPTRRPQGHLSVVDPAKSSGDVFCVDARPQGGARVRAVRFTTLDGAARGIGDAPVEEDGSFFARVPADVPLVLDLVDADGAVVGAQHTPFWVRPGETRGCIGCHEEPDTTPPNVRPRAVLGPPVLLARAREAGR
jgi:hypothetical protein